MPRENKKSTDITPSQVRKSRASNSRAYTQAQKDSIYIAMKDKIVYSEWKPGEFLNETKLSADFGVSRTLLREVIQRLISEGLLGAQAGQGTYVRGFDLIQYRNTVEVKVCLEEFAGRLAAERVRPEHLEALHQIVQEGRVALEKNDFRELTRLDWRFHSVIGEATRNPTLASFILQLVAPLNRLWYMGMCDYGLNGDPVGDWSKVLEALERRSPKEAAQALVVHMARIQTDLFPLDFPPTNGS